MSPSATPVVDVANPMYCPEIPATRYLQRLQEITHSTQHLLENVFARRISMGSRQRCSFSTEPEQSGNVHRLANTSYVTKPTCVFAPVISPAPLNPFKRKRDNVDTENPEAPCPQPKRIHSDITQTSSFILSPDPNQPHFPTFLRAAPVQESSDTFYHDLVMNQHPDHFFHYSKRVAVLEGALYGYPIGKETPEDISRLLAALDRELPGISLKNQLSHREDISHQDILDILGVNGNLVRHILDYFRGSLARSLDLSTTLSEEDGLVILNPRAVLDIFALPHSFTNLQSLNLNHVTLDDFLITKIHHLPSLRTLWLNDTGIGNEAVGHLTALKYGLKELHIEDNPGINDDCVSSLCLFSCMILLRISGTNIEMPGLRRLASAIHQARREIDIEIPQGCDNYLNNLHTHYQLRPSPPLITNPSLCTTISTNALKTNLAAHAACNPSISLSGSRVGLQDRLQRILEERLADRVVKEIAWGYDSSDNSEFNEVDDHTVHSDEL